MSERIHLVHCGFCQATVEVRARTRLEAIALLDDPAAHKHLAAPLYPDVAPPPAVG